MAGNEDSPPMSIIVSTNRDADFKPYIGALYNRNPDFWREIYPWEFPKSKDRKVEEDFLRQYFDEDEIRMQGGATGEGLGFKFLKRAWYDIAIWNADIKVPEIAKWWRAQECNQSLLNDPTMLEWICSDDAKPSTFFDAKELRMYGDKALCWVIKHIQAEIKCDLETQTSLGHPRAASLTDSHVSQIVMEPTSAVSAGAVMEGSEFHSPNHNIEHSSVEAAATHKSDEVKKEQASTFKFPQKEEAVQQMSPIPTITEPMRAPSRPDVQKDFDQNNSYQYSEYAEQREYMPTNSTRGGQSVRGRRCSKPPSARFNSDRQQQAQHYDQHVQLSYQPGYQPFKEREFDQSSPPLLPGPHQILPVTGFRSDQGGPQLTLEPHSMSRGQADLRGMPYQDVNTFGEPQETVTFPPPYSVHQRQHTEANGSYWNQTDAHQRKNVRGSSDEHSQPPYDHFYNRRGSQRESQSYRGKRGSYNTWRGRPDRGGHRSSGSHDMFHNDGQFFRPPSENFEAKSLSDVLYLQHRPSMGDPGQKNWRADHERSYDNGYENGAPSLPASRFGHSPQRGPPHQNFEGHGDFFRQPNMVIPRKLYDPNADDKPNTAERATSVSRYQLGKLQETARIPLDGRKRDLAFPPNRLNRYMISQEHTHVRRIVLFDVPDDVGLNEICGFMGQFGQVLEDKCSKIDLGTIRIITFNDHFAIMKVLENNGIRCPWGVPLRAEVSKQYWDPEHKYYPSLHPQNRYAQRPGNPSLSYGGEIELTAQQDPSILVIQQKVPSTQHRLTVHQTSGSGPTVPPGMISSDNSSEGQKKTKSKKKKNHPHNEKAGTYSARPEDPASGVAIPKSVTSAAESIAKEPGSEYKVLERESGQMKGTFTSKAEYEGDPSSTSSVNSTRSPVSFIPKGPENVPDLVDSKLQEEIQTLSNLSLQGLSPTEVEGEQMLHSKIAEDTPFVSTEESLVRINLPKDQGHTAGLEGTALPKVDEDAVEESFHTASGSPPEAPTAVSKLDDSNHDVSFPTPLATNEAAWTPKTTPGSKRTPGPSASEQSTPLQGTMVKELGALHPAGDLVDSKKEPPPCDPENKTAETSSSLNLDDRDSKEHSRDVSLATTSSIPGSKITTTLTTLSNNTSDAAEVPVSKKPEKPKGPAYTESMSMFGKKAKQALKKKEKGKKSIGGSLRSESRTNNDLNEAHINNRAASAGLPVTTAETKLETLFEQKQQSSAVKRDSTVDSEGLAEVNTESRAENKQESEVGPSIEDSKSEEKTHQQRGGFTGLFNFFGGQSNSAPFSPELKSQPDSLKSPFAKDESSSGSTLTKTEVPEVSEPKVEHERKTPAPKKGHSAQKKSKGKENSSPAGLSRDVATPSEQNLQTKEEDLEIGLGITTETEGATKPKAKSKKKKKKPSTKETKDRDNSEAADDNENQSKEQDARLKELATDFAMKGDQSPINSPDHQSEDLSHETVSASPSNTSPGPSKLAAAIARKGNSKLVLPQPSRKRAKRPTRSISKALESPAGSESQVDGSQVDDNQSVELYIQSPAADDAETETHKEIIGSIGKSDFAQISDWRVEQAQVGSEATSLRESAINEAIARLGPFGHLSVASSQSPATDRDETILTPSPSESDEDSDKTIVVFEE